MDRRRRPVGIGHAVAIAAKIVEGREYASFS
jgi:hypothetical protein